MRWPSWRFSQRFSLRTLVIYTVCSVLVGFVSKQHFFPVALRYTFYVVGGIGGGTWVFLSRRDLHPLARCSFALGVGAISILIVVGAWKINSWLGAVVFIVALICGAFGYWTFVRALDAKAAASGGYWAMLRQAATELKALFASP